MNQRQREMLKRLLAGEELTGGPCEASFGVTRPVITKDLKGLVALDIAVQVGRGRATRYRLKLVSES
ncbi:MAG: hypothetical protein C5B50_20085 [Verrucomicrobia bacterium]|nr:MAG: hypothetical protein C5B50_20085 [Verrucomicrobiota bacterium]